MDNKNIYYEAALDGWSNLLTNLGPENSTLQVGFSAGFTKQLSVNTLENLYVNGGVANIICTEIPADGMKSGISIEGDKDNKIQNNLDSINSYTNFYDAWSSARAFGGSLLVMDIDDGAEALTDPVDESKIKAVSGVQLYDRTSVVIDQNSFCSDEESEYFGEVEFYTVTRKDGQPVQVHASRVLYFAGDFLPWERKKANDCFDGSVIQRTWGSLSKLGPAFEYINKLLQRFNVLKFGIKGLSEKLAAGKESEIKTRLRLMKMGMSTFNAAIYDPDGENITAESLSLGGLADLLKQYFVLVSSESRIPVNRLFTKLVGGLGEGGDSDEARYYDHVQHEQKRVLTAPYNTLIRYIAIANAINPDTVLWEFEPLKRYSKKELVDMQNVHVKSLVDLYDRDIITREEARESIENQDLKIVIDATQG